MIPAVLAGVAVAAAIGAAYYYSTKEPELPPELQLDYAAMMASPSADPVLLEVVAQQLDFLKFKTLAAQVRARAGVLKSAQKSVIGALRFGGLDIVGGVNTRQEIEHARELGMVSFIGASPIVGCLESGSVVGRAQPGDLAVLVDYVRAPRRTSIGGPGGWALVDVGSAQGWVSSELLRMHP